MTPPEEPNQATDAPGAPRPSSERLFIIDPRGAVLAGPPELRHHLSRDVVASLLLAPGARLDLDEVSVSSQRIDDPANPWLVVRLAPRARATPFPSSTLTARQLEVARLAALGRRCHEIGRQLGCSANTIRSHLRVVYDRLAVTNRVELMRALAESGPDGDVSPR